jgi:hypothetical protein
LRDLLKDRGFVLNVVADRIDVGRATMYRWTNDAPISKLIKISEFTRIPLSEIVGCFITDPELLPPEVREGAGEDRSTAIGE